jgi:hypothetical protein
VLAPWTGTVHHCTLAPALLHLVPLHLALAEIQESAFRTRVASLELRGVHNFFRSDQERSTGHADRGRKGRSPRECIGEPIRHEPPASRVPSVANTENRGYPIHPPNIVEAACTPARFGLAPRVTQPLHARLVVVILKKYSAVYGRTFPLLVAIIRGRHARLPVLPVGLLHALAGIERGSRP